MNCIGDTVMGGDHLVGRNKPINRLKEILNEVHNPPFLIVHA